MLKLNYKYLIKVIINNPFQALFELKDDFFKDYISIKTSNLPNYVWCIALPKSGSTIVENIFQELPYTQGNKSFFRKYTISSKYSDDFDITADTFNNFPKNKFTFIKTHTSFSDEYFLIKKKFKPKIIFLERDIADMMISRYFHIMSDPNHWQFKEIYNLELDEGFLKSCTFHTKEKNFNNTHLKPIEFYCDWLKKWKKNIDNDVLYIKYETFIKDKKYFIGQILDFIGCENSYYHNKILYSLDRPKKKENLKKNLNKLGRNMSTFRSGNSGDFERLLKDDTKNKFREILKKYK